MVELQTESYYTGACDRDSGRRSLQLEMAQELDRRSAEIDDVAAHLPSSTRWNRVHVGPLIVRERNFVPAPEAGWQTDSTNWDSILHFYTTIKGQATNLNWLNLNMYVRGLIPDDQNRLGGTNVYNDKDAGPSITLALKTVTDCLNDAACSTPAFDAPTSAFMSKNGIYAIYLKSISDQVGAANKRGTIKHLQTRLTNDARRFTFHLNSMIKRITLPNGSQELHLPMAAGPLAEVKEKIQAYIENTWTSDQLNVKIDWTEPQSTLPTLFKFVLGDGEGGRSYVMWSDYSVHLFNEVRAPSIAHETGHVLGFTDHYYTTWVPETCTYQTQTLPSDLMSDSEGGSVTSDDWAELNASYPAPQTSI